MMIMSLTRCIRNNKEEEVYDAYYKKTEVWIYGREKIFMFLNMIAIIWDMEDNLKDSSNPFLLKLDSGDLGNMESNVEKKQESRMIPVVAPVGSSSTKDDSKIKDFGSRIQEQVLKLKKDGVVNTTEVKVSFHHDPRVNKAFGVVQLADYCQWETFIRDYNDKLFKDFSSRWRVSLGKIAKLYKEKSEESPGKKILTVPNIFDQYQKDGIYDKCVKFVENPNKWLTENKSKPISLIEVFKEVLFE